MSKGALNDFIEAEFAVVEFYKPRCNLCRMLWPECTKASIELKRLNSDIK